MILSVKIIKSRYDYIARCPDLDVNCYGKNEEDALNRMKHVIQFYLDAAEEFGIEIESEFHITGISNTKIINPPFSTIKN